MQILLFIIVFSIKIRAVCVLGACAPLNPVKKEQSTSTLIQRHFSQPANVCNGNWRNGKKIPVSVSLTSSVFRYHFVCACRGLSSTIVYYYIFCINCFSFDFIDVVSGVSFYVHFISLENNFFFFSLCFALFRWMAAFYCILHFHHTIYFCYFYSLIFYVFCFRRCFNLDLCTLFSSTAKKR